MIVNMQTSPSFGHNSPLKKLYKKGKLPYVNKGFYGGKLTPDNVTLEHLKLFSEDGATSVDNLVLATKKNNHRRANRPIEEAFDKDSAIFYLKQFEKINPEVFDGEAYIKMIKSTLKTLGIDLEY